MRSGAWFKALQRIDRVLFDLTIRVVNNIRSTQLAKSILVLTKKLENAMKGGFSISFERNRFAFGSKNQFHSSEVREPFS